VGLGLAGAAVAEAPPVDFSKFKPWTAKADTGDYVIGPPYADAPELTPRDNVPKGMVYQFTMESTDSKMYPGIAKNAPGQVVPYQRRVTVYVPSQYQEGKPAPFLVSQDSMGAGQLPTILDNMIADHRLPAMVAVMINSGGGDAQGSERGLEYDTVSGKYAEFIETEVLPRISRDYHVTFTRDPDGRMTMGGSSGAACAFTMAWFHPELYHRVVSYSGTFVNQQSPYNPESPHGAWEYHEHLIPESKRKPLRIWMHVGEQDLRYNDDESTLHNWPLANIRMAAALKAKKYPYQFVFARESRHVDGRVVRQTLPQALEWVWKGYRK
jgi:enterochelin esterase family protein